MNTLGTNNKLRRLGALAHSAGRVGLALAFAFGLTSGAALAAPLAANAPGLGLASHFAVLAGTAVTCTDSSIIGDVGAFTAITQGPNCPIDGSVHLGGGVVQQAYSDFLGAYANLAQEQCDVVLTGNLAGLTLPPGVYCVDALSATTDGTLTLNGPANGIWIFKIGTSGTGYLEGTNFSVVMEGGGAACNVYWWVAEYAELTTSNFVGTILAGTYITITGGTFHGDAFAQAAVTLTGASLVGCEGGHGRGNGGQGCNQGVGNGPEDCDPGNSNQGDDSRSNDEEGGTPGDPGRKGGNGKV